MIAIPVTSPCIPKLNAAKVKVWLPDGIYYDVFTGRKYRGGRILTMYRDINSIPVLAKAGAIVPMTDEINDAGSNRRNWTSMFTPERTEALYSMKMTTSQKTIK